MALPRAASLLMEAGDPAPALPCLHGLLLLYSKGKISFSAEVLKRNRPCPKAITDFITNLMQLPSV